MAATASPMWHGPTETRVSLTNPQTRSIQPAPGAAMHPGPTLTPVSQTPAAPSNGNFGSNPKVGNPHDFRHVAVTPRGAGVHHHHDMPAPTPINLPNQTVGTAIQF